MIHMYQLIEGHLGLQKELFLTDPPATTTRGHSKKVAKPKAQSRVRRNLLTVRSVNDWNSLPGAVVVSTTTNHFKNQLDDHWEAHCYDVP